MSYNLITWFPIALTISMISTASDFVIACPRATQAYRHPSTLHSSVRGISSRHKRTTLGLAPHRRISTILSCARPSALKGAGMTRRLLSKGKPNGN
jgi:hypothetical protein